jgi:hypothetical protein
LTPLLLVAQEHLNHDPPALASAYSSRLFQRPSIWITTLIALFCTLDLSNGGVKGSVLSIIAVIAQFVVYFAFLPRTIESPRLIPRINDFEDAIVSLSWRTVVILTIVTCIHTTIFGFAMVHISSTIFLGIAKALFWYFVARMVCS